MKYYADIKWSVIGVATYAIPTVLLVKSCSWDDKWLRFELDFLGNRIDLAIHGESQNAGFVIQRLDKGGIVANGGKHHHLEVKIRLVQRAAS